jgi:hypothetical protein
MYLTIGKISRSNTMPCLLLINESASSGLMSLKPIQLIAGLWKIKNKIKRAYDVYH